MCATSPLPENFEDIDFIKGYDVFIQNQVVCTLVTGALSKDRH